MEYISTWILSLDDINCMIGVEAVIERSRKLANTIKEVALSRRNFHNANVFLHPILSLPVSIGDMFLALDGDFARLTLDELVLSEFIELFGR